MKRTDIPRISSIRDLVNMDKLKLERLLNFVERETLRKQPLVAKRFRIEGSPWDTRVIAMKPKEIKVYVGMIRRNVEAVRRGQITSTATTAIDAEYVYQKIASFASKTVNGNVAETTRLMVDDWISAVESKGNVNDWAVIDKARKLFTNSDWRAFFSSSYFQKSYVNYAWDESDSLIKYIDSDDDGLTPWVRRLVDFAKTRNKRL